ncbi:MAG: anhydro-N-acetylmuramic acid kinase, partial [Phycisphaerales bacterium]|nr:anhydro-N-acetylmuramic acid kinase [Phycisphaerales bacterium]
MTNAPESRSTVGSGGAARRVVVGVMTGTSIDGLDAALVRIDGRGLEMRASLVRHLEVPLGPLGDDLRRAAAQEPLSAASFAELAWSFGELHACAIATLVEEEARPDLVAAHGQTVFHHPPVSWQLLNPFPIAQRLGCPVVCDLRQADLAAGGQGAPITPLADWVLFRDPTRPVAVVNLGGFCNITLLPADRPGPNGAVENLDGIRGFDVCACNHILNAVAVRALGTPFDRDGAAATAGRVDHDAARALTDRLDAQRSAGRSLGAGDEALAWAVEGAAAVARGEGPPADLAATAVEGVAGSIAAALDKGFATIAPGAGTGSGPSPLVVLAGGGARNAALFQAIERRSQIEVIASDD